jgi:hypothetical protein
MPLSAKCCREESDDGILTRQNVALLELDTLGGPGALDLVVVLGMVRPLAGHQKRDRFTQTSLLEMGTESWTILPISLTLALRTFSFSAAEASRSFFSFSMSAGTR